MKLENGTYIYALSLMLIVGGQAWCSPLVEESASLTEMGKMTVKKSERIVPDKEKVGIPSYPDAKFCMLEKEWGEKGWTTVTLLSTDSFETVKGWYRDKLKGWDCMNWGGQKTHFVCQDKKIEFETLD